MFVLSMRTREKLQLNIWGQLSTPDPISGLHLNPHFDSIADLLVLGPPHAFANFPTNAPKNNVKQEMWATAHETRGEGRPDLWRWKERDVEWMEGRGDSSFDVIVPLLKMVVTVT